MKNQLIHFAALPLFLVFYLSVEMAYSKIPEPDNIIYGLFPSDNTMISLWINDTEIASYTRGDVASAGQNFILRVPMDSIGTQDAGTARPGDEALLFLDSDTDPVTTVIIAEKGSVHQLILPETPVDFDRDGILDIEDNCTGVFNPDQDDANNNGMGDACDSRSDTDGDGYSDKLEYDYFHAGILDLDGYGYDPLVVNPPGDTGYYQTNSFWILMMPVILDSARKKAEEKILNE